MAMAHDLIIVGGGPAGLSEAIYAARFRMDVLVLAKEVGGTVLTAPLLENWPGDKSIPGRDLMDRMADHVKSLGVEIKQAEVKEIKKKGKNFRLLSEAGEFAARSVLLATGTKHRKLEIPGEAEFSGRGVSYCAVCDAAFFKDKAVAVVGGSDSAAKEALLLSEHAEKVYIVYRRERIRAEPINVERVEKSGNIEVINNANVLEIKGDKLVKSVVLDRPYKGSKELGLDGVFVSIGYEPLSGLAEQLGAKLDGKGQIIADASSKTGIPGLYAAGDVTSGDFKQAIVAAAQGAVAAYSAYQQITGGSEVEEK